MIHCFSATGTPITKYCPFNQLFLWLPLRDPLDRDQAAHSFGYRVGLLESAFTNHDVMSIISAD